MEEEKNEVVVENQNQEVKEESIGMSLTSMILGIVGLIVFALPCGILAIIFSIIGKKKGGKGFAIAGLILGIIDAAFGIIAIIASIALVGSILG